MHSRFCLFVSAFCSAVCFAASSCFALDWEVERNFRYFVYPSDVAIQRVAADMYFWRSGRAASPEDLELFLNGPDFWTTSLQAAGGLQNSWPADWRNPQFHNPSDLVTHLREAEGRAIGQNLLDVNRLGWASILAHKSDAARPFGNTDTCWDPRVRMHTNCKRYGDYVRPLGWIVRVYDADVLSGGECTWSGDGGFFAGVRPESDFASTSGQLAAGAGPWTQQGGQDCREIRVYVPSDPSDPKAVKGKLHLKRIAGDGSTQTIEVAPSDQLIIGFGDSFTSGEGNPELPAVFTNVGWPDVNLPKRSTDPSTRAQWTDRWCHRSVYSWQVRTALDVALRSPHRSVTLLPYGCSGAEIFSGLLFAYNGVEYDHSDDHGVIGHRAAFGLAYQELCDPKSYASVTGNYRQPRAQNDAALAAAVQGNLDVDVWKARLPDAAHVLSLLRKDVTRCNAVGNHFKRAADLVLLDIGINDVGFASWVAGLILDGTLRTVTGGFIPQIPTPGQSCDPDCKRTELLLARLVYRYQILRDVLDKQFLPDIGLSAVGGGAQARANVIVPLYPKALEDENGALCGFGNRGMTVTTFPNGFGLDDQACKSRIWPNANGSITAIRNPKDVAAVEWFRNNELNKNLRDFALKDSGAGPYDVVDKQVDRFAKRGFCATLDAASRPPAGKCFAYGDLLNLACATSFAESLHVPRNGDLNCGAGAAAFSPFLASDFLPYRSRTRLLRTQNDVYMLIDNRDKNYTDNTKAGILDLNGRTTSGAFHPTAEAHSIVAAAASEEACKALACER
jgi:hypothetical protein